MSCEDNFTCSKCKSKLEKQLSSTFYVAMGMKPTMSDRKEEEHRKKVKDPERARRRRIKVFGHDAVGDPVDKPDPRHIVKRGKTIGGQQMEVDRGEFIKAAAKDPAMVRVAQESIKKSQTKRS